MIRDSFPVINSPGQAPVDRALGFSASCTKLQWVTHQASVQHAPGLSGVGGGASDFLGKCWGILEPVAKFWESSAGNSGKIRDSCIIR